MTTIRRFLVIALVAVITLANFVAALRGYLGSMDEAENLFNQRMQQEVDLLNYLLPALLHQREATTAPLLLPARASVVNDVSLQFQMVSGDGRLLARSAVMPNEIVVPLKEGFIKVNFHGYRWHLLVAKAADFDVWFVLAERDDQRYRLAESMILQAVYPMVFAIPIIGIIIWWVLGVGLRPIKLLARELSYREATDLHPITQHTMPAELVPLAHSANELLRRLAASFAREKRFSADAAHELRTPIAALRIHCDNLLQELQPTSGSALKLQQGIERMSYLVEQILMLNRMAPDHFMGNFAPVNLSQLVKNCVAEQSLALETSNHHIEFNGDECWIKGDRLALETLINNLLGNAIKYTPPNGHLSVNTWWRGKDIVLEIMDDGPGIPESQYDRVFDRFYRLGGDRHQSASFGCGLGLSIVKQIVDLHSAQITLTRSRFASGLLVIVIFSACEPGARQAERPQQLFINHQVADDEINEA